MKCFGSFVSGHCKCFGFIMFLDCLCFQLHCEVPKHLGWVDQIVVETYSLYILILMNYYL